MDYSGTSIAWTPLGPIKIREVSSFQGANDTSLHEAGGLVQCPDYGSVLNKGVISEGVPNKSVVSKGVLNKGVFNEGVLYEGFHCTCSREST